jgi:hypothetical protein
LKYRHLSENDLDKNHLKDGIILVKPSEPPEKKSEAARKAEKDRFREEIKKELEELKRSLGRENIPMVENLLYLERCFD